MTNKRLTAFVCSVLLALSTALEASAAVSYLPFVTKEMSNAAYWTSDGEILMTYEEIEKQNSLNVSAKGTYMNDLKNQPETVDGVALNERLFASAKADVEYYLGWTYIGSESLAAEADYESLIENTQNKKPLPKQPVLYAVAVKYTQLRTFPSPLPIWDDPTDKEIDYQYLTGVRVNEPLVILSESADGKYYLAKSICCSGWVDKEDVAICQTKEEWLSAWDLSEEKTLIVYGDKVYTEMSFTGSETSQLCLTMGTALELAEIENPNELIDNRAAYQNYAVWLPIRKEDGSYAKKLTLIPEHAKVSEGYLKMTKENIAKVAFEALGNTYGWGGGVNSDDCSGYIRNVYKCFGLELARNTSWQAEMPVKKVDMTYMCLEERQMFLDALPFGSVLFFKGHEMMYLGKENGKYYVISAVGSILEPYDGESRQRIRSTIINTLDIKRANGNAWINELTAANVPYWGLADGKTYSLPGNVWYHDALKYCLEKGIMQLNTGGSFCPAESLTMEELAQIMSNLDDDGTYETVDFNLEADAPVAREQLAAALYGYAQYKGYNTKIGENTNILSYTDAFDISEYAIEAMQYAVGSGVIKGKAEDTVNPKDTVTRAEAAVIIYRFTQANK